MEWATTRRAIGGAGAAVSIVTLAGSGPGDGWFTEGFGTRDLKEAKVLLVELA